VLYDKGMYVMNKKHSISNTQRVKKHEASSHILRPNGSAESVQILHMEVISMVKVKLSHYHHAGNKGGEKV
jgi:hypothetical protein